MSPDCRLTSEVERVVSTSKAVELRTAVMARGDIGLQRVKLRAMGIVMPPLKI